MNTLKLILYLLLLFSLVSTCTKTDVATPAPVVTTKPFTGCRISEDKTDVSRRYRTVYSYNDDGTIDGMNVTNLDNLRETNSIKFFYKDGLLTSVLDDGGTFEQYDYTNGALSKITITKTPETAYVGYQILVETDATKRITAMTDSKGFRSELTRDANGNVISLIKTRTADKEIVFQMQLSDFDTKKSIGGLFKGWPFDFAVYYKNYMTDGALLVAGTSGNARKIRTSTGDVEYRYTYSTEGYPTRKEVFNKTSNKVDDVKEYTLQGCQ